MAKFLDGQHRWPLGPRLPGGDGQRRRGLGGRGVREGHPELKGAGRRVGGGEGVFKGEGSRGFGEDAFIRKGPFGRWRSLEPKRCRRLRENALVGAAFRGRRRLECGSFWSNGLLGEYVLGRQRALVRNRRWWCWENALQRVFFGGSPRERARAEFEVRRLPRLFQGSR
jgi:hypothetical protein